MSILRKLTTITLMMGIIMSTSAAWSVERLERKTERQANVDSETAKFDPLTMMLITNVGIPLASNLFNKVMSMFSGKKGHHEQATQNSPLLENSQTILAIQNSNGHASVGSGRPDNKPNVNPNDVTTPSFSIQDTLSQACYVYLNYQSGNSNDKNSILNQVGNIFCQILTPINESANATLNTTATNQIAAVDNIKPHYSSGEAGNPLNIMHGYGANYQGIELQIEMLDKQNNVIETRSAVAEFKSGERFRLKITPTFTGLLQIRYLGSDGKTAETLFPQPPIALFQLNAGHTFTIPASSQQFYYFDQQQGTEQIIIQFTDNTALDGQYAKGVIYRQDDKQSTYLMQEVSAQQHPFILQTIAVKHQ